MMRHDPCSLSLSLSNSLSLSFCNSRPSLIGYYSSPPHTHTQTSIYAQTRGHAIFFRVFLLSSLFPFHLNLFPPFPPSLLAAVPCRAGGELPRHGAVLQRRRRLHRWQGPVQQGRAGGYCGLHRGACVLACVWVLSVVCVCARVGVSLFVCPICI